ncbi:six-hairpin glycosidase-1 [Coleophoma crateriformis]|uniref:Six-hairpin glycosidase-1 n=1 Tax=Coleophoma crateriformis TaxID=565419 RepID=A0A3D8T9V6_9HELO|nr:six-hairpin glycosidase-1 [Coleophoma crateriformis]
MRFTKRNIAASALFFLPVQSVLYEEYILAPASRTIYPSVVHQVNGTVSNANSLLGGPNGSATFHGNSSVTFDFTKNVGGVVSVTVKSASSADAFIGLTYTESSLWINGQASDATADAGLDEVVWLPVGQGPGTYTVPRYHDRGAFRYLSLVSNATTEVTAVSTNFTAAPVQDLRAYRGFFHCNDEALNRVWYAGAYTNQICNIDPNYGNALVHLGSITSADNISLPETVTWYNNATIANGSSVITDGAKRDREIWPGDMSVAVPSIFVSTNDLESVKNSLNSLLSLQNATTGMLPYAGIPFSDLGIVSFTYHLYSLIGISYYYQYTGDVAYLQSVWPVFTKGLGWSLGFIDSTGLMNVTSGADWLRVGMGGHNIEANAILYYTINQGLGLAAILNKTSVVANWTTYATNIKSAANTLLWNATTGLYHDNETTLLSPQDGNAWALKSNLTLDSAQSAAISSALQARWGQYGAPAPEAGSPLTVSPFIGSFELEAHFLADAPQAALDLIRLQWADFMLDDPRMTNSTFIEGYSFDGSLHYAPYANDPRVSHAHGWSSGPTSLLSFYVAGLHLLSAEGATWKLAPALGDLTYVHAGFQTGLGSFESEVQTTCVNGSISALSFSTPAGTTGSVSLPGIVGSLQGSSGVNVTLVDGVAENVSGGTWTLVLG